VNILSIGGSDPSSGAGIQADIKAATALGANCFSVITAVTSQNSVKFVGVEPVSPNAVEQQLSSILSDFEIDAINIGMVYDSKTIAKVHSKLKSLRIPITVDPVIKSTTSGNLLEKSAFSSFVRLLVPLARVITPNVKEAEILTGMKITSGDDLERAARKLSHLGAKCVVITGHKFIKNKISEFVYEKGKQYSVSGKKINTETHGSGCNFAIALSYSLAQGKSVLESVKFAKEFALQAIKFSQPLGHGIKITSPKKDAIKAELGAAISKFQNLEGVYSLIPEVQTNFVFSKHNAKSINDIVGVSGRIVKAGKRVIVAGDLEYGGSRHVASAVLTMQKKFPQIRSALNVKFDDKLIKKFQKDSVVASYDRTKEPTKSKLKENSSIVWGIQEAIKNFKQPPDIIYHRGDVGKEPMIIVFGKNPNDVLRKISKIL
jgi:hydroxymethylpyrimidine/phosphomethylpyrimidine kinase